MCTVIGAASSFGCVHGTNTKLQAAPITVHVALYYKSHIYELTAVLPHAVGDRKVKRLLYATVHSLMMDQ
jgi:hypothetical protein